ncbi:hypothetical protein NC651_020565 [Populus alba x Populus x berolinensis]|nr:hypothetical protein NC651_020565 [Populus alba x Populus x berolinensis]
MNEKETYFFLELSRTTWDKKEVPPTHARAHDCSHGSVASLTCAAKLLCIFFFVLLSRKLDRVIYQGNMNIDSETFKVGFQPNARHPEVEPRPEPDHLGLNGAEIDSKMVKIGFEAPRGEAETKSTLALDRGADELVLVELKFRFIRTSRKLLGTMYKKWTHSYTQPPRCSRHPNIFFHLTIHKSIKMNNGLEIGVGSDSNLKSVCSFIDVVRPLNSTQSQITLSVTINHAAPTAKA